MPTMMTFCPLCERQAKGSSSCYVGEYQLRNLCCCARLVISARPSKPHQERMLAVIAGHKRHPRHEVLNAVQAWDAWQKSRKETKEEEAPCPA